MTTSNFVTPQAASSPTFRPPPLDGTLSIPDIYDFHLRENGNHPLFVFDGDNGVHSIQWRRAVQAIHTAGKVVQLSIGVPNETPVVAILAVIGEWSSSPPNILADVTWSKKINYHILLSQQELFVQGIVPFRFHPVILKLGLPIFFRRCQSDTFL
jgi:hypothetical protein